MKKYTWLIPGHASSDRSEKYDQLENKVCTLMLPRRSKYEAKFPFLHLHKDSYLYKEKERKRKKDRGHEKTRLLLGSNKIISIHLISKLNLINSIVAASWYQKARTSHPHPRPRGGGASTLFCAPRRLYSCQEYAEVASLGRLLASMKQGSSNECLKHTG